jgi:hypothetical protein
VLTGSTLGLNGNVQGLTRITLNPTNSSSGRIPVTPGQIPFNPVCRKSSIKFMD